MKKLLTFALLAAVGVASAASIDWKTSTARNTYVWDSDGNKFNGTAYLVLADDVATILAPTEDKTFQDLLGDYKIDEVALSNGAYAIPQRTTPDSTKLEDNTRYDFQVILVDSNGNYSLSSDTQKSKAYIPGEGTGEPISFGAALLGAAGTASASTATWNEAPVYQGGGQPGVPEPATGALALAGVAHLFKRRRA